MPSELSTEDYMKYRSFITRRLENQEGLAAILLRLRNHGVDAEMARELVKEVAKEHSKNAKRSSMLAIVFGTVCFVVFLVTGVYSGKLAIRLVYGGLGAMGGVGLYFRSRKRLNYLNSLS